MATHRVTWRGNDSKELRFEVHHNNRWEEIQTATIEEMPTGVKELYRVMQDKYQDFICCVY